MVDSSNLNSATAAAADLEKGEVWEEDLEEGETYEEEEGGDLGKRGLGEVHETLEPNLLEPLLSPEEAEHQELEAGSKPLILTEKIVVSLLVVIFVLVEAYFVGRSFRNWIDNKEHFHVDNGNSTNITEFVPMSLPLELPILAPVDGAGGGVQESIATPESLKDVLEGSLDSGDDPVRESLETSLPMTKMSTRMTRLPPGVVLNSQSLVQPLMEEEKPISADDA